jgi:hypothetical protein
MALLAALLSTGCYASHTTGSAEHDGGVLPPARDAAIPPSRDAGPPVRFTVTDTTGGTLRMSYSLGPPPARVTSESELPFPIECPDPQLPNGRISWNGRLLVIQARCQNWVLEIQSRPVVCEHTSDCEPALTWLRRAWEGESGGQVPERTECLHGLCQFPDHAFDREDLYSLCLDDTPRWPDFYDSRSDASGYPELEALVREHCRGECTVPDSCRQPEVAPKLAIFARAAATPVVIGASSMRALDVRVRLIPRRVGLRCSALFDDEEERPAYGTCGGSDGGELAPSSN